jgi:hypothetical protein
MVQIKLAPTSNPHTNEQIPTKNGVCDIKIEFEPADVSTSWSQTFLRVPHRDPDLTLLAQRKVKQMPKKMTAQA